MQQSALKVLLHYRAGKGVNNSIKQFNKTSEKQYHLQICLFVRLQL